MSRGSKSSQEAKVFLLAEKKSIYTDVLEWRQMGCWRDLCNCTIFMCGFIVTTVIIGDVQLGLHAENLFIVHNCPPWIQGHYINSKWEKRRGVIAGRDLGSHYWKLSVCCEVRNLGLQMTLEGDVFWTGGSFGTTLGGEAYKAESYGHLGGRLSWTFVNVMIRVNFWSLQMSRSFTFRSL